MNYKAKYIKYKLKYLRAKQLYGGMESESESRINELGLEHDMNFDVPLKWLEPNNSDEQEQTTEDEKEAREDAKVMIDAERKKIEDRIFSKYKKFHQEQIVKEQAEKEKSLFKKTRREGQKDAKQGGMFPLTEDSETAREGEKKREKKQAIEAREQGIENPLITRRTPSSHTYPIEPYGIQTDTEIPTLGDSPSKEIKIKTQTDIMPKFNLGTPQIPTKK
tara:strand:- start:4199 stop:4858 length:660 start_codon:yes stop_codon:yes gene_type:complete